MLKITIPATEMYDEANDEFVTVEEQTLELEHSLVSLSKWEAKWKKPFLTKDMKTRDETVDYIRCMTITQNVDPNVYNNIPDSVVHKVNEYISDPMTATWFNDDKKGNGRGGRSSEQVTSELIYFWMISFNIPFDCQKWHLSRLMTLIKVCEAKNQPSKKMSKRETANQYRALNAARRKGKRG